MIRLAICILAVVAFSGPPFGPPAAHGQPRTSGPLAGLSYSEFGWFPVGDNFIEPASGPGPVGSDPEHPYYSNQSGRQPTSDRGTPNGC